MQLITILSQLFFNYYGTPLYYAIQFRRIATKQFMIAIVHVSH